MNPPLDIEGASNALSKFSYDCAYFRRMKRDLLASGWSESQIFGRAEIDVDTILLGFVDPQDNQPVSTWCSRTVNKILPASSLPVRLASTWLLTKMMRVSFEAVNDGGVSDTGLVPHLAKRREPQCKSGMVDTVRQQAAGRDSIRHLGRSYTMVCRETSRLSGLEPTDNGQAPDSPASVPASARLSGGPLCGPDRSNMAIRG